MKQCSLCILDLRSILLHLYSKELSCSLVSDMKLVAVKNCTFRIEHAQSKEESGHVNTQEDMMALMSAHFPTILVPYVKSALHMQLEHA